ncbi:IS1 family transposase [Dactylococcopsis salina]
MNCPKCHSSKFVKNGHTHYGKQRFRCQHCGRQFVNNPSRQPISQDKRDLIDKLLKERLALAAIARVAEVSERWLQDYVNQKYYLTPKEAKITEKKRGRLILEIDEMWSFVGSKRNKVWIWLAIDSLTHKLSVFKKRDRDRAAARKLWDSLPPVYRQCATCYTDFWEAYQGILPTKRHQAVGKETGQTNHIERFNNTLRQRVGRLVRKSLSFSKKFQNHLGAIWDFIHYYKASLQH